MISRRAQFFLILGFGITLAVTNLEAQTNPPVATIAVASSYEIPQTGSVWIDIELGIPSGYQINTERLAENAMGFLSNFSVPDTATISILETKMPSGRTTNNMKVLEGTVSISFLVTLKNQAAIGDAFSVPLNSTIQLCDPIKKLDYKPNKTSQTLMFTVTSPSAKPQPTPVVKQDAAKEIAWFYSHAEGQKVAQAQGKRMFVLLTAPDWCVSCQKFELAALYNPEVIQFINTNFVPIKILETVDGKRNPELGLYQFEAYPTYIVLEPNKTELFRASGGTNASGLQDSLRPYVGAASNNVPIIPAITRPDIVPEPSRTGPFMNMILVEGGTFQLGPTIEPYVRHPAHTVTVSSFYMSSTETTVAQFRTFVNETGYSTTAEQRGSAAIFTDQVTDMKGANWQNTFQKQGDDYPVIMVSWYDTLHFCNWLSKKEGLQPVYSIVNEKNVLADWNANGYRQPTDAEWEYAARGGKASKGYSYAGTNDPELVNLRAGAQAKPVASKIPNELGFYDMSHNVWEWCWDWGRAYPTEAETNPHGYLDPDDGMMTVIRGGRIGCVGYPVKVEVSSVYPPGASSYDLGFRVVRNEKTITLPESTTAGGLVPTVMVEGGTFQMGANTNRWVGPAHPVTVNSFYMGTTETTIGQFKAFINETKYQTTAEISGFAYDIVNASITQVTGANWNNTNQKWETDNHPVTMVSWYDSLHFCNWLSQKEGLQAVYTIQGTNITPDWNANGYRLPTEAEWEYAARGGNASKGYIYAGTNDKEKVNLFYRSNSGTNTVATKIPNELGLYDMSHNVWEWCWDGEGTYTKEAENNPLGTKGGKSRMKRGGSQGAADAPSKVEDRSSGPPDNCSYNLGFRVARNAP